MPNTFRALEASRAVVDEINRLLDDPHVSLIHRSQLRESAQSIAANIREGVGRDAGRERNTFYRVARGSAEETDEHLRANVANGRIPENAYWRLHNRLMLVVKMLDSLMRSARPSARI